MITALQRTWSPDDFASDCWCPIAPGACRPPYDLQPASLIREPRPLDPVEEAATVLSGAILEHLRAGHGIAADRQVVRLAALLDPD